ncbi:monovalent cation:H+ antiporter, CPA1 family [Micromonospora phaseoli]|uniref:Monovalent cation:H+ antiporter, CPA1 family n=1 Tax=Micromonospora phaseoli TaxID=1144548 RepID=A0A1H6UR49_9ACTN|nr:Na+/H+ antiporter [Micromonospora phaseoli]PZV98986.1 sodium/proton antiporter (CPA1 family) [Micromonospora phaseoli]GIJ76263.1 putative Na(+)/H(+) exchanger [Micromonospora phaseoli]SEI90730.1 monovalent cation:H+ antiporter, CPA1 family [Micromonospora phaseoli]
MRELLLVIALGVTVLVGTTIGGRYRVAPPVLLICLGALLALLPPFAEVTLAPEVVLLLFLPAILYRESLATSLREVRANLGIITLLAVGLVGVTMVAVSLVVQRFGVDPAVAWVLGAVLAPTDAAAVAGLAKRMPRRLLTTLRAESLINDGTALVLFAVALGLLGGGAAPTVFELVERVGLSFVGGIAAGLLVGTVVVLIRKRLDDPLREGALSVLTPFTAFFLADAIHESGVLAVVVSGLIVSFASPRVIRARSRVLALSFWDLTTFLINGGLFVLVGLQIPRAVRNVTSLTLARAITITVVVAVVLVLVRMLWLHLIAAVARLDRRESTLARRVNWRVRTVAGWAGFRGAVSLAAALAVPLTAHDGEPVPERDLIIFCVATVILLTMLVQGTTLPFLMTWAGLTGDPERVAETRQARVHATQSTLAALSDIAERVGAHPEAVQRLQAEYEGHLGAVRSEPEDASSAARETERRLRLAALEHKRREIIRMRDRREIDDTVLRELQASLDAEEIRLLGPMTSE